MDRLKTTNQKIEAINCSDPVNVADTRAKQYRRTSGPRFEERFRRVTTYIENDLFRQIESLREQGKIINLTALFNEALLAYMKEKFGK